MKARFVKILTVAASVVAAAAVLSLLGLVVHYLYTHDPAQTPSPKCVFKVLTGYDCPGCGSQRAFHALLHGRLADAWGFNPFVFFAVPLAVLYVCVESMRRRYPRLHAGFVHPAAVTVVSIAVVMYWILRNA